MNNLASAMLLGIGVALSSLMAQADITVEQGYVRASPPGMSTGAAFMTLHNSAMTPVSLTAARTPAANSAELHNHIKQDGVLRMRQVSAIEIPAQGSASLKPGGYHVMLLGLKAPLKAGSEMQLLLEFSTGQRAQLSLPIRKIGPMKMNQGGHNMQEKTPN